MAHRRLSKAARFERMFKIWEYLRRNTDSKHPTTQAKMRTESDVADFIGDKETFNRLIKDMARAMNSDEYGDKAEEEWRIFFDDYKRYHGNDVNNLDIEDDEDEPSMHIKGLYYNRTFSYEEINILIEGVLTTKTIDSKTTRNLIEKVEKSLTTKFYKRGPRQICKVYEPELVDKEVLRQNLIIIQKAIDNNVQINFRFNGYTHRKILEPIREEKDVVSPYYIVVSGGRYYLLACKEILKNDKSIRNMSIWRVDLMTDIDISDYNEMLGISGVRRVPKRDVENLPLEWTEDFQFKHLNLSFDKPKWITLRIKSVKRKDDPTKRVRADYTFLHDWFGNNFKYIESEKEPPYDDIVKVECSPYGMVNWALQYSDRVEVLEPEEVRKSVIEKVKVLNEKYNK